MNILDSDIYRRPPLNYDWNSISEYALTVDGYALAKQFLRLSDQGQIWEWFNLNKNQYHSTGSWNGSFEDLRTQLFLYQRGLKNSQMTEKEFLDTDFPEILALYLALIKKWEIECGFANHYRWPQADIGNPSSIFEYASSVDGLRVAGERASTAFAGDDYWELPADKDHWFSLMKQSYHKKGNWEGTFDELRVLLYLYHQEFMEEKWTDQQDSFLKQTFPEILALYLMLEKHFEIEANNLLWLIPPVFKFSRTERFEGFDTLPIDLVYRWMVDKTEIFKRTGNWEYDSTDYEGNQGINRFSNSPVGELRNLLYLYQGGFNEFGWPDEDEELQPSDFQSQERIAILNSLNISMHQLNK